MLINSIKNSLTLPFDSWKCDEKPIDTKLEYQVDIGSAKNLNSPKHLSVAQQTAARIGVPNKANNVGVFDNLGVRKYFVDIDAARCPGGGVSIDYASNDYVDQYRDPQFII